MKSLKMMMLIIFTLILTGCADLQINYNLENQNNPTLSASFYLNNKIYQELQTSPQQMIEQIKSTHQSFENWNYKIIKKNHQQIIKMSAPKKQALSIYKSIKIKQTEDYTAYTFKLPESLTKQIDFSELKDYQDQINLFKNLNSSCQLHLSFPTPISKTSLGTFKNHTLTINLLDFINKKNTTFIVKCTTHENQNSPAIIIVFFVIFYIIILKYRKRDFKRIKNS